MNVAHLLVRPAAVRRKVEQWLAEADDSDVIVLLARPVWTDDPVLTVAGQPVRVVPCPTPLAGWAALADRDPAEKLVLLTNLNDAQLGDGLLAHASRHTARRVDPWDLARQSFGGQVPLDTTLVHAGRWLADAITETAPPGGWPPPPGAIVTRDHALRQLTAALLGLEPDELDGAGLLQWTLKPAATYDFMHRPDDWVQGITRYLTGTAGPLAVPVLAAVRADHGADVIPLGLLAGVLWPRDTSAPDDVRTAVARTRLEPWFGGTRLTDEQATAFAEATEAWVYRALDGGDESRHEAYRMLHRAEEIAARIDVTDRLGASALLPSGFTQRMRAFAAAVRLAVPLPAADPTAVIARVQHLLTEVEAHRSADRHRVEKARMAVRLLRWLATPDTPAPDTMLAAVHRQVRQDSWVDRARLDISAGDVDCGEAYLALHDAVDARRRRHDEQFAALLQDMVAAERQPGALLLVEDVLERVLRPILDAGQRVLLLVLDGMGTAAAIEIADSLRAGAWTELTPHGQARTGVLAALPTVTAVNRHSLFAGRITTGGQDSERRTFTRRFPGSVLFHKGDLRTAAGVAVAPHVVSAIDDPAVPVVAAVINTIDDALERSSPGSIEWSTETINELRDLLTIAQDRVVVLLSDHGHVVDRGRDARVRAAAESTENRWRPATGPAGDGELLFAGSRVGLGDGRVVLPWREELRYGPRKAGYHGGASPAEAVIPLLVYSLRHDNPVPGWAGAPVASPDWWREPLTATGPLNPASGNPAGGGASGAASASGNVPGAAPDSAANQPGGVAARPARRTRPPAQDESLFEIPATGQDDRIGGDPGRAASRPSAFPAVDGRAVNGSALASPAPGSPGDPADRAQRLAAALLASPVYAARRDSRAPLPDERVAALVSTLIIGNGRATTDTLATRAGIPVHRINSTVTALRRLLQVEGYPVLSLDPDGRTAKLDIPLMIEQFGLDGS